MMNNTGYEDKNGKVISLGDEVMLNGVKYEVTTNVFTQRIVVDSKVGQENLLMVADKCELID